MRKREDDDLTMAFDVVTFVFIFVFQFVFSTQVASRQIAFIPKEALLMFGSDAVMAINSFWLHVLSNDVTTEAKLEAIRKTICSVQLHFQAHLAL